MTKETELGKMIGNYTEGVNAGYNDAISKVLKIIKPKDITLLKILIKKDINYVDTFISWQINKIEELKGK